MTPSFILKSIGGLHSGPLRPYAEPYVTSFLEQGYNHRTIRRRLLLVADLNRWLVRRDLHLRDLNEKRVERFWKRHPSGRKRGSGARSALHRLLGILRKAGVISPAKIVSPTPAQCLANRFRRYLIEERGFSVWAVGNYTRHIEKFLVNRFGSGPAKPSEIQARDLIAYVQRNARHHSPPHTKRVATALRSFLRFLRYGGQIQTDLASFVPSVATWRMTSLPKHLPAEAVQRILDCCDQTRANGLRNYAILLLLARLGLRAGEIVALRLEDIDWDSAHLLIRSQKRRDLALRLPHKSVAAHIASFF